MLKRYWISWYQPTKDERPKSHPPNARILGWWNSGRRLSDDAWTLCALVLGDDEAGAQKAVRVDWPEATEWRFCDERSREWRPADRFPVEGWIVKRIDPSYEGGKDG